ncbi:MAG: hypothetical protein K2L35_00515, partial [Muribaculaceae bacterium]|nr:hypothetical protein [Muribaculaceae bacterium]
MMMLSGCSEKDVPDNFDGDASTDKNSYIAVTIAANFADTRAGNSDDDNADDENYQGGSQEENQIKTVRFYFFDSEGKMAKVKRTQSGEMVNYLDLTVVPGTDSSNHGAPNVDKGLNAVLVINTAQG